MTLEEMCETMRASARRQRDAFQEKYPHYTPPPWADRAAWMRWCAANIAVHGRTGFYTRFPRHAFVIENSTIEDVQLVARLQRCSLATS